MDVEKVFKELAEHCRVLYQTMNSLAESQQAAFEEIREVGRRQKETDRQLRRLGEQTDARLTALVATMEKLIMYQFTERVKPQ